MFFTKFIPNNHIRHFAWAMGAISVALPATSVKAADFAEADGAAVPPSNQTFDKARLGGARGKLAEWEVIVGAGAMYAPKYEGSDEFKVMPVPFIAGSIGPINLEPLGVSVDVFEAQGFKASLKASYEFGRDEDDSKYLKGLGDIDGSALLGGKVAYEWGPIEVYGSVDKWVGGSDGLTGTVGANVNHQIDRFLLGAGASATFADDNHMKDYFGVTAAQSARSGLREHRAEAGLKRVDLEASVTYLVSESWIIRGQAGVGFLTGDAKDSPIVRDDIQPSVMLSVGYKF